METAERLRAFSLPLVGIAAFSGTGKTTLLAKVLPILRERDLRVAVVKHAHHDFEFDRPGKDSYRFRDAGANETLVASRCRVGWIRECAEASREPRLGDVLGLLDPQNLDLVLVEGFKSEPIPKIELHRSDLDRPLLFPGDPHIAALACDMAMQLPASARNIERLSIDDPGQVADFICRLTGLSGTAQTQVARK